MGNWVGKFLIARAAVYRIDADDGTTLRATILNGSDAVRGRVVGIPKSNARANIALGFERLADDAPPTDEAPEQGALPGYGPLGREEGE